MNEKVYITIVYFIGFNRELKASFEDSEPPMRYTIKKRIQTICPTAVLKKFQHYEGHLVHQEIFNK